VGVDLTETRTRAEAVAAEWGLSLGEPFALSRYSYVAPVGDELVLKVAWAGDEESLHEDAALALWDGDGAVRLERADRSRRALLAERAAVAPEQPDRAVAAPQLERLRLV
jgi:streptomycin 6-kinase